MKEESLEELRDEVIKYINESKRMDKIDKIELMINIGKILENKDTYEESIKVLRKGFDKRKEKM